VHWERKADVIVDLNHTWKGLARARPNTRWVDLHHALIDSDGHLATAFHQGDGVHFSSAGNRVVAEAIRAAIAANGSNS
jgi:lysophospholipase L1-like esterase